MRLSWPVGIAVDSSSGNVYVADTANHRIQVFSSNGTFIISEWGRFGGGNGSFNHPQGIAVDQEGNVYVADTANNRIQVFSSNGTFISKWGRFGGAGLGNDTLKFPADIAVDSSSGNVYVADTANNRIQVFSNSTMANTSSTTTSYDAGDNGVQQQAEVSSLLEQNESSIPSTSLSNSTIMLPNSTTTE